MDAQEPPALADASVGESVRFRGTRGTSNVRRAWRWMLVALAALVIGAVIAWTSTDPPRRPSTVRQAHPVTLTKEAHEPSPARRTVSFGRFPSFRQAVLAAGLSPNEAVTVEETLEPALDFSRCHETDQLVIERSPAGALLAFEYRTGGAEILRVRIDSPGQPSLEREQRPIQHTRRVAGASITVSIADAIEGLGLPRSLSNTLVQLFDGQVNFSTDVRAGDQMRLVVEEERLDGRLHGTGTLHAVEYDGQATGHLLAVWFAPPGQPGNHYDHDGRPLSGSWLAVPLTYDRISSPFNPRRRHPILRRIVPHTGVDYAAPSGTTVWAAARGRVTFVGYRGPNGNLVTIRHENGFETHYAHLSRFASGIRPGASVEQRHTVGYVGSTGRSTGPHLHFALRRGGAFVDPLVELRRSGPALTGAALSAFRRRRDELIVELSGATVVSPGAGPEAPHGATASEPMD